MSCIKLHIRLKINKNTRDNEECKNEVTHLCSLIKEVFKMINGNIEGIKKCFLEALDQIYKIKTNSNN